MQLSLRQWVGQTWVRTPTAAWSWVTAQVASRHARVLVVAPDAALVESLADSVAALLPPKAASQVAIYPHWDVQPYDRLAPSAEIVAQRRAVMAEVGATNWHGVVVSSVAALGLRERLAAAGEALSLKLGSTYTLPKLSARFAELGYVRVDVVQHFGEFAVRGGLVDIFPPTLAQPLRLDFFGDELDGIAQFDPQSQKTTESGFEVAEISAAGEVLSPGRVATFRRRYRELFPDGMQDDVYVAVSEGRWPPDAGQLAALLDEEPWEGVLDVLPPDTVVIAPDTLDDQLAVWGATLAAAYQARCEATRTEVGANRIRAIPPALLAVSEAEIQGALTRRPRVTLASLDGGQGTDAMLRGHLFPQNNRHAAAQAAAQQLARWRSEGWSVCLCAPHAPGLAQFIRAIEGEGAPPVRMVERVAFEGLTACVAPFTEGWIDPEAKTAVLTEGDVFGSRAGLRHGRGAKKARQRSTEELLAALSVLKDGDYVVHDAHGIGRYTGLVTMTIGGAVQDFLKLIYAGDDRLFVPVEQLDQISRYKGAETGEVHLDRLGTGGWETRKAKVKADLLAMAGELLSTAAARELAERTPLAFGDGASGALYDEFCAGFPYALTDDQARVIAEVEADLAGSAPMDRLVVGDVGFGKTEVALRAAFLVAAAGKQVAIVCPTTLLARQHFALFSQRFAGFGLEVAHLSRLVGAAESKLTKQGLADGRVRVVVGTHALLGKDMAFANLGLVIIDEEQRFGVAHKERLKTMKSEVDILTLTATPIPRTLQLAVGGVRGLSLIATPPVDRHAVQTYVLAWDNVTLKGALTRELTRGGQVYVVAPHVEDLARLESNIASLVPHARVGVAHGQMSERALEDVMLAFYDHQIDVLVATTIIESGLDVPRANTMIVYRSDRFGLAQLYQLRGRVGRSTAQAYAYFILPEGGFGAGDAGTRLHLLQQLQGLGAGLTLANYDMDLRGFGNVLGKEQSGNIRDIGFELYAKMLKDAVQTKQRQLRQVDQRTTVPTAVPVPLRADSVTLKLGVSYLIPAAYVSDEALRLQLYRRLAAVNGAEALAEFGAELDDRFGPQPPEVQALLAVVGLRNRAAALNISKIEVGEKGVVVTFQKGKFAKPDGLIGLIAKLTGVVTVRPDSSLVWHRRLGDNVLTGVKNILSNLEDF
jgi:transcription-repair coupling factor (superfamily II helicase)